MNSKKFLKTNKKHSKAKKSISFQAEQTDNLQWEK